MKLIVSASLSIVSSFIFFLFGEIDIVIKSLLTVMILDYITGLIKGFVKKEISSQYGFKGILKKILYLVIVVSSVVLDNLLNLNYCIRDIVAYSFILNEIISIIENCGQMGIKLPTVLTASLEIFHSKITNNVDELSKKTHQKNK